jgi:hypothetical protein
MISFYLKHFGSYIKKTCFRIVMNSYIKKNEIWIEKYIFIQEYKSLEFLWMYIKIGFEYDPTMFCLFNF